VSEIPDPAARLLDAGEFCYVAASTPAGPHVTPMVYAVAGERLWVTTSRRSVKARAWRDDPRVAGLVRVGSDALMFTGTATTHDALSPRSWRRSLSEAPMLAVASARFTRKNARFFAGYAFDARKVPLAWTPPGRVFVELEIERTALLEGDGLETWGDWGSGAAGLAVVPARWTVDGAALYAVVSERTLALAGASTSSVPAALCIDLPSTWRAREMVGAMARGEGEIHVVDRLRGGEGSARAVVHAAGADGDPVLLRIRQRSFVWWQGWESGTVAVE
jgi:hypothetical protein